MSSVCGCPSRGSGIQSFFDPLSWPDRAGICRLCHKNQLNHVFFQHLAWLSFMETKWKLLETNWETLTSACALECRDLPRACSVPSGHHFLDPKRHLLFVVLHRFWSQPPSPLSVDIPRSWLIYLRLFEIEFHYEFLDGLKLAVLLASVSAGIIRLFHYRN